MKRIDIINKLIKENDYNSYLEIGLYDGKNFENVNIEFKIGIDPNLTPSLAVKKGFIHLNSDNFFDTTQSFLPDRKFDIIFIDGDHESSQVEKDIVNSYQHLEKGGVILLHDCNPPSKESQMVPRIQGEYCGTVWRSVVGFKETYGDKIKTGYFNEPYGMFAIYKTGRYQVKEGFTNNEMTYEEFDSRRKELLGV